MNYYLTKNYYSEDPYIFSSNGRKYRYNKNPKDLRYSGKVIVPFKSTFPIGEKVQPVCKVCKKLTKGEYIKYKLLEKYEKDINV